ncbi:mCG1034273 [Mus musculus]|nr:mCG1034273 [Mus musculus]
MHQMPIEHAPHSSQWLVQKTHYNKQPVAWEETWGKDWQMKSGAGSQAVASFRCTCLKSGVARVVGVLQTAFLVLSMSLGREDMC